VFSAECVQLNADPAIPAEVLQDSRWADNWRPLIAIADAAGKDWGTAAREAAIELTQKHQSEHINALLIKHLWQVFAADGYPTGMWSEDVVKALLANDEWPWKEFRGVSGQGTPRKLRQTDLAAMLKQFDAALRPRNMRVGKLVRKAFLREALEPHWRSYCPEYREHETTLKKEAAA
jgi:hypothetical protein